MNLPKDTKPFLWGAAAGAIVLAIVGFSWGGWVTGGTSEKRVATATHDSTVMALAPLCAERFRAQGDASAKLAELSKASSWDRAGIVEKGGFATQPGAKSGDSDVARACAEILSKA
jgi:hypothetical protein